MSSGSRPGCSRNGFPAHALRSRSRSPEAARLEASPRPMAGRSLAAGFCLFHVLWGPAAGRPAATHSPLGFASLRASLAGSTMARPHFGAVPSVDPQRPSAELLIAAYARGIFPMADPRTREIEWFSPDPRGIFPLESFHVPRRLARTVRAGRFEIRTNTAFETVMRECAALRAARPQTWIDERLITAYVD